MQKDILAIIDLGTNTFHLLIAEVDESENIVIREKYKEPVKLGEGGINSGKITEKAFTRGIKALKSFRKLINSKKANKVFAFGTSAIRGASNGKRFVQEAREEAGVDIKVINGNEEASLIFEGVKNGVALPYDQNALIIDIGGGSVEFIVVKENKPLLLRSLDIGAARLLDLFDISDPVNPGEIKKIEEFLRGKMDGLLQELKEFEISLMVGSSGSFETLGSMVAHENKDFLSTENLNSYQFPASRFVRLHKKIQKLDRNGRTQVPGMDPIRVDMILMSNIILDILVQENQIKDMMVSNFALKEGILFHYLDEKKTRLNHLLGNTDRNLRAKAIRNLAKKYHYIQDHALKVSEMAAQLFDLLHPLHHLGSTERELLRYSSMLHDIGHYLNRSGHHKHGQYIVMNSGLSGFSNDELLILGNIIRYHRKSLPTRDHFHFKILRQSHRLVVRTLAGILRIADNLDRGHRHLVSGLGINITADTIEILVKSPENIDIEITNALDNKGLMESIFARKVKITLVPVPKTH